MAHLSRSQTGMSEPDLRVEDYLDDKLQSTTDLDELDNLLAQAETQRAQLQQQLDAVSEELGTTRQASETRQAALSRQMAEFAALQQGIDVRARIVAASDAPDAAIRRLERPMQQLHRVDLAVDYLQLLQEVERLRAEARARLPQDPRGALEPYAQLRRLAARLRELQRPADEAAAHLVHHVGAVAEALWAEMKRTMWAEMDALLVARGWAGANAADAAPPAEVDAEWSGCFEKLVDLQTPEVLYSETVVTLLPVDVMARVFVKEFRFHFLGNNQTSSLQSIGTHCFPWFIALVEKWEDFFRDNFGYILASRFQSTSAAHGTVYVDPACALITSMLPVMREKLQSVEDEALKNPAVLSSLVSQLLAFDESIRDRFGYDGGNAEKGWAGLADELLAGGLGGKRQGCFDAWLRAEKEFALERFHGIMATPDARNLDYDFAAGAGTTATTHRSAPTHGAVRVADLLRSVTGQYRRVRRLSHQLRFLIDIQLAVLDAYHDRLRGSLEAYHSLTSTVGRTLHGATREQLAALEGTGALETLCRVFGSADHVVVTLREWSNEGFFVGLWEQLHRGSQGEQGERDPTNTDWAGGGLSYDEVKERTSAAVGSDGHSGVLFDETIAAYSARRKTAHEFLVSALIDAQQKALRPYLHRPQWTTVSDDAGIDLSQLAITAELDEPLHILKRDLAFLSRALGTAALRRVWRPALEKLQDTLWSDVLLRQHFTTLGAAQLLRDVRALCSLVDTYIPDGPAALDSLCDGLRLLNLPLEVEEEAQDEAEGVRQISLKQAGDRLFTDNAEAKKVLEELGIETLTPAHARQIVQRRVEYDE